MSEGLFVGISDDLELSPLKWLTSFVLLVEFDMVGIAFYITSTFLPENTRFGILHNRIFTV